MSNPGEENLNENSPKAEKNMSIETPKQKSTAELLLRSSYPIILMIVMVLTYAAMDRFFVKCEGFGENHNCVQIDGALISQVEEPINLAKAKVIIAEKTDKIKNLSNFIKNEETTASQPITTQSANSNTSPTSAANTNTSSTGGTVNTQLQKLTNQKTKIESELLADRQNIAERYSSRMLWVFLTGIFMLLSFTAIGYAVFVILEPFDEAT